MNTDPAQCFAASYADARQLFLDESARHPLRIGQVPHPLTSPEGQPLALDWAATEATANRLLIVSSGLHGVEGYLGSAAQVHYLRQGLVELTRKHRCRLLLLHALNPYGFAHSRRWDENNVDPNRNFLLPEEQFSGASATYRALDTLLNPRRPPARWERPWYLAQAAAAVLKHGLAPVKQAVAGGQYEFPQGLFFGGDGPCWTHRTLEQHLPDWVGDAEQVIHIDFHTGLGPWASCRLLIDYRPADWQRKWLAERYPGQWEEADPGGVAYHSQGVLGNWCQHRFAEHRYTYLCAEFGTYRPLTVLAALRAENQGRFHSPGGPPPWTANWVREVFCPRSARWRRRVLKTAWQLALRAAEEGSSRPPA